MFTFSYSELSYNRDLIEGLLEHDLVIKETATYHLLVEKYIAERKEEQKNAGLSSASIER